MISFDVHGHFTESAAKRICERLNGRTYMNFHVYYVSLAGNCVISVETYYDCTEQEAKNMFYYNALYELASN